MPIVEQPSSYTAPSPVTKERIAALGECMLELRPDGRGGFIMGFGGDTLNTAVYLARLGASVDYVTALGDDTHSAAMVTAWQAEGVGCDLVARVSGRVPGLYMIETDPFGERRFLYWRDSAPARDLFVLPGAAAMMERLMGAGMIFVSGISLAIWGETGRNVLYPFLDRYRAAGGTVVFDTNLRPRLWPSLDVARTAYDAMLSRADIALPGVEDLAPLVGTDSPTALLDHVRAFGITEGVLKLAQPGCIVWVNTSTTPVPAVRGVRVVDTTAAGDSFAAGYLAARRTLGPVDAAHCAARLAAAVVSHPGAIIDRAAMPTDLLR